MDPLLVTYKIPLQGLKFSTNKIYAGVHWGKRKQIKDSIAGYAAVFCRPNTKIESYPVEIRYRFVFESRPLDTLNCAAMAKMFEDALRALGILKEDDPAYVAQSVITSVDARRSKNSKASKSQSSTRTPQNEDYLEIKILKYDGSANSI